MRYTATKSRLPLAIALATAGLHISPHTLAQQTAESTAPPVMEEVLIFGRLRSSADTILDERMEQSYSADILGFEQISRIGDPDVASAVRRITGLTLVEGKYVYVRGLGERYSSVLLNGAAVPSPELARNVIPLDLFPTSIVETIKVHKSYSADLPANFGGGSINIRTKSIPDDLVLKLSLGSGINTEGSEDGIFFERDRNNSALPATIKTGLDTYLGQIRPQSIAEHNDTDGTITEEELTAARATNRDMALSLYRDFGVTKEEINYDSDVDFSLGNAWDVSNDITVGALLSLSSKGSQRNKNTYKQSIGNPDVGFTNVTRTLEESNRVGALNFGINYKDMHKIETNSFYILNAIQDAAISQINNRDFNITEGSGLLDYSLRYEERELMINQILGNHEVEANFIPKASNILVDWYYSDATANTTVPGALNASGSRTVNPSTGETLQTFLTANNSMASFAFLDLEDNVESAGWDATLPFELTELTITLNAGYDYSEKTREYYQYTPRISAVNVPQSALTGQPSRVLSNNILGNLDYPFELNMDTAFGKESYIAAQKNIASFGSIDILWNEALRFSAGLRWEDFQQGILPVDVLDYTGATNAELAEALQNDDQKLAIKEDDLYPSFALTYMSQDVLGASDFQIRVSYSETAVRPDLREMADAPYIDPEDQIPVLGNPYLEFSDLQHLELKTEFYYDNGDNFTVTAFYKDIKNPIEQSRISGSEDDIVLTFVNGEAAEIYGIEFEGLKDLSKGFFVSGNVTLSDSTVTADTQAQQLVNMKHPMTGHSEYVINAQLGYDSNNEEHSASLAYNVFGERLFYSSLDVAQHDDAYEKPFHSLDATYSYYPTDQWTVKLGLKNLLDEKRTFEQDNASGQTVTILEQNIGTSIGFDVSYTF